MGWHNPLDDAPELSPAAQAAYGAYAWLVGWCDAQGSTSVQDLQIYFSEGYPGHILSDSMRQVVIEHVPMVIASERKYHYEKIKKEMEEARRGIKRH
jgi:hypothetical protein